MEARTHDLLCIDTLHHTIIAVKINPLTVPTINRKPNHGTKERKTKIHPTVIPYHHNAVDRLTKETREKREKKKATHFYRKAFKKEST